MAPRSILLLSLAAALALSLPVPENINVLTSRQSNSTTPAGATPQTGQLTADELLADGIALNLMSQQGELSALQVVSDLENSPNVNDPSEFAAAKNNLLGFVSLGTNIRQSNQDIAPAGNPATMNLAQLALAQQSEMTMAQSLTGDPLTDGPVIQQLGQMIQRATAQNSQSMNAATFLRAQTGAGVAAPPERRRRSKARR